MRKMGVRSWRTSSGRPKPWSCVVQRNPRNKRLYDFIVLVIGALAGSSLRAGHSCQGLSTQKGGWSRVKVSDRFDCR